MTLPFVSCLCVTRHRRIFLRQAVNYFLRQAQHYTGDIELVILDGSDQPNPEFKGFESVRYFHNPAPEKALGLRQNVGAQLCRGEVIIQWDDDDWQAPNRVARQVQAMSGMGVDLLLNSRFYWYDIHQKKAAQSPTWNVREPCGFGSSFAYTKKAWALTPFRHVEQGPDNHFWRDVQTAGGIVVNTFDPCLFIYIRHGGNVSVPKVTTWDDFATQRTRDIMGLDVKFYDEILEMVKR